MVETKRGKGFCNPDLTTEDLNDINIDDYHKNDINNRQIIYQNIDQSRRRRNNNQNNNDKDIPSLEDEELYDNEIDIERW